MFPAASVILIVMLLDPERVIEVLREVPSPVAWSSLEYELPAFTETCRVSPETRAALSVAVSVWAAVLVLKSSSAVPVSAEMSTLLKLMVGAVAVSYTHLTLPTIYSV